MNPIHLSLGGGGAAMVACAVFMLDWMIREFRLSWLRRNFGKLALTEDCTDEEIETEPVVHAYWVDERDPAAWKCSKCSYRVNRCNNTPYCPRCGVKMDEEAKDDAENDA